jgi:hypothetical protein
MIILETLWKGFLTKTPISLFTSFILSALQVEMPDGRSVYVSLFYICFFSLRLIDTSRENACKLNVFHRTL